MPATCIDNIISIPDGCSESTSLSGFSIFDLPGISIKRANKIADEDYVNGITLIRDKNRIALLKIKNDIIAYLQGNGYYASTIKSIWQTKSEVRTTTISAGTAGQYRGIVLYTKQKNCLLNKMFIPAVYVKTNVTGELVIRVEDGVNYYNFAYDSIAGSTLRVPINYTAETDEVKIMLPSDTVVYSIEPNCQCNRKPKSDCATVMGISNNTVTKTESYGIYADVQCVCDYTSLLCHFAKMGLMGEIVLYLTGALIAEEATMTDRLGFETTYGKEQWEQKKGEWLHEYGQKWNTLIASMPGMLPKLDKCGCIECGTYKAANV